MDSKLSENDGEPKLFRQGDLLIEKVERISDCVLLPCHAGLVLAEGEATGHRHVVEGDGVAVCRGLGSLVIDVRMHDGTIAAYGLDATIFELRALAKVVHPEHGPIPLETGMYVVTRQQQYLMDGWSIDVGD